MPWGEGSPALDMRFAQAPRAGSIAIGWHTSRKIGRTDDGTCEHRPDWRDNHGFGPIPRRGEKDVPVRSANRSQE